MINEKFSDFNTNTNHNTNHLNLNQVKVPENYVISDARSKIIFNWEKSLQNTIKLSPAVHPIDGHKVKTKRKSCPRKQRTTHILNGSSSDDYMKHAIDIINSVANCDFPIHNKINSSQTLNNLSANIFLNDCLTDYKFNSINDLNNTSFNIDIQTRLDSIANNSDLNLNSTKNNNNNNNNNNHKFKTEPKPKRKKCDKSVSSDVQTIKREKKVRKQNSKNKLKVKLFNFNPDSLGSKNDLSICDLKNDLNMNDLSVESNGLLTDLTLLNTIINSDNHIKQKRLRKRKTQIVNPFMNSFQNFLDKDVLVNNTTNLKVKTIRKKKSQSQIHAEKAVKKSREIKSNSVKIKRKNRAKPLVVKNLSSQKSFLDFIDKKFPPIKEGVPFIQDRSCRDFKKDFPSGISYCLDCNDERKGDIQTCRFYQYRTIIKKDDELSVYGFAEPDNATQADSKVWLPGVTPLGLDPMTAKFLLTFVGQQLCKIFNEENNIIGDSLLTTWKKPVKGIRELCDVCQTTIFNTHWVCPTCGYAVCIDCYKSRITDGVINGHYKKNYDEFGWHLCNQKVKHDFKNFHLALFITKSVFGSLNLELHNLIVEFGIMGKCCCKTLESSLDMHTVGRMSSNDLKAMFVSVPQQWYCGGRLLVLTEPKFKDNIRIFQIHWLSGDPVMVQNVHLSLNRELWTPESFNKNFGKQTSRLVNCMNGNIMAKRPMRDFWNGFEDIGQRLIDQETGDEMLLKLKDWPPNAEFRDMLPLWFDDLMDSLPLKEYTRYDGIRNLSSRLPEFFVRPDLGPKMYCAYGSVMHPDKGTTNLHLDMSDAINVMIYVGIAHENEKPKEEHLKEADEALLEGGCDEQMRNRVKECGKKVGALWHIFRAEDSDKIRELLAKVAKERNYKKEPNNDPIHDQSWYLDKVLQQRLLDEYNVKGFAIAQCLGDAILIPAGAPHQVRNLHSCIKVAGEFVSPENIGHSISLTHEFRKLSKRHNNHEDKLQIKNVIYHSVKDSITSLLLSKLNRNLPKPPILSIPPVPLPLDSNTGTDSMPTLIAETPASASPPIILSDNLNSQVVPSQPNLELKLDVEI